jgi:ribosome biogenesis GTPase
MDMIKPDWTGRGQDHRIAKSIKKARKQIKHNRKPKGSRRRDWTPGDDADVLEEFDVPQTERVMPRGERERRRAILNAALADLKENECPSEQEAAGLQGVVVEVSSSLCRVDVGGRSLTCGLRGSLSAQDTGFTNLVAVGDHVIVSEDESERGIVEAVLPRRSILARPDVLHRHLQQVFVANADQLLIVASWREPAIWLELIDRYLIAAERHNLTPIICVNKVDLAQDEAICHVTLQPYLDLGYRVIFTSALTGVGVSELCEVLRGRTTALAGLSGVGKSSLLAAVQPGLQFRTGKVSNHSHEGRHTTTQVTMLPLAVGGFVVDTPGIREFGLSGLRRDELVRFYPEIVAVQGGCRFSDCSHVHEPGCAVQAAVDQGHISEARYHNYRKIYPTLARVLNLHKGSSQMRRETAL